MTLDEAIRNFESRFEEVIPTKAVDEDLAQPRICAGGIIDGKELFPALYSSKDQAIMEWLDQATSHAGYSRAKLRWILKPELCEFQITMADKLGRHRIVSPRFTVKSQFQAYRQGEE